MNRFDFDLADQILDMLWPEYLASQEIPAKLWEISAGLSHISARKWSWDGVIIEYVKKELVDRYQAKQCRDLLENLTQDHASTRTKQ